MGAVKIMARAIEKRDLEILKEKIESEFGLVWFDGVFPDREGGYKAYLTFEVKNPDDRRKR